MIRPTLPLCLTALAVLFAATHAAAQTKPPAIPEAPPSVDDCRAFTERLADNLAQVEALQSAQVLLVVAREDGAAEVFGFLAEGSQREAVETEGLKALVREAERGELPRAPAAVDASGMVVLGTSPLFPLEYVMMLDRLMADVPACLIRPKTYHPATRALSLCGVVESEELLGLVESRLPALAGVDAVDVGSVILADQRAFSGAHVWGHHDVHAAVREWRPEDVVDATTRLIRRGYSWPDAWFLRAAGHLMEGREADAVGDVRIARAIESDRSYYRSQRFRAIERVQGPVRTQLERMVALGPASSIVSE